LEHIQTKIMTKNNIQQLNLDYLSLAAQTVKYQLSVPELVEEALKNGEGTLADTGALAIDTGKFTGRSPKDRFIVCDSVTENAVWWGDINIKISEQKFNALYEKMIAYVNDKTIYVRDSYACANEKYGISIRVITEYAFQNIFANNLFLRYKQEAPPVQPEWTIIAVPSFLADPETDGTRQQNFSILNFSKKMILIGGTAYTGEIKKGIFSVLNFVLPAQKNTLSMHCSANVGKEGDTAIFFGLSGTGKTTLSADPDRALVGDDEHGWGDTSVFNFEGGCYAKCVDLSAEKEPQIFKAIKFGALLENINYFPNTRTVDFSNIEKTENTRVAYPLDHIENALEPSVASIPKNIFFLTADAFGVLPPISKLTPEQAMFHFISGYTAKVAGTETGVTEPQLTFSACFGKAFLPLHPMVYAELLGQKMKANRVNVWLVNTGWSGGPYGVGSRMKLAYTRAMIASALNGSLEKASFVEHSVFGLHMPTSCENVPSAILDPRETWHNKSEYDLKANELAVAFLNNFKEFDDYSNEAIRKGMPKVTESIN
jgi:phosphoenolpyruvate carboxykinase (ATP)